MNPGRLRHRITIQQHQVTQDELGNNIETWSDWATIWANIRPVSGREYFQAAATNAEDNVRINIRYRSGIDPLRMRVVYGNRVFDILSAIDLYERHREIEMVCRERR
jgi:SPP1 family predicted phage head-tail adaptor